MEALEVKKEEAGQKLVAFLGRRVDAAPAEFMRWLRTGQARLNGGRAKPFERVAEGDLVRVPPFAALRAAAAQALAAPFPGSVYEDEELLVLNKPAGLPTHGGSGHSDSLAARLALHFAGHAFVPAPAHRLDKSTSGLVLAGKSYACQRALQDDMADPAQARLSKEYLAWVDGLWPAPHGMSGTSVMEDHMRKEAGPDGREIMRPARPDQPGALLARAEALLLDVRPDIPASLLLLRLFSGRTHQLRLQLALRGHPIVGDGKYGKRRAASSAPLIPAAPGLLLHACRIGWRGRVFLLMPPWPAPFGPSPADILPPPPQTRIPS